MGRAVSRAASKGSGVVENVTDYVQESYLYRWLTAEPEPDVVVIDLRETYTVGPFIRLLDATIEWLQPYWEASTLKRGTDACIRGLEWAAATKPGRVLASILAPPEPPERAETRNDRAGKIEDTDDEREQPEDQ
ncbi:hypothetical protein [Halorubellus salinus]|uniref:hypothetical protein n=1 Tax=Halorubellus salinus TaxID=755309 RepID=UPI001D062B69|nr:hypothetical protein [Halorubellus salinus]